MKELPISSESNDLLKEASFWLNSNLPSAEFPQMADSSSEMKRTLA